MLNRREAVTAFLASLGLPFAAKALPKSDAPVYPEFPVTREDHSQFLENRQTIPAATAIWASFNGGAPEYICTFPKGRIVDLDSILILNRLQKANEARSASAPDFSIDIEVRLYQVAVLE